MLNHVRHLHKPDRFKNFILILMHTQQRVLLKDTEIDETSVQPKAQEP